MVYLIGSSSSCVGSRNVYRESTLHADIPLDFWLMSRSSKMTGHYDPDSLLG